MSIKKMRYVAIYFINTTGNNTPKQSSFIGTKRAVINRLKRLSSTDGLEIYSKCDGELLWGAIMVDGVKTTFVHNFFSEDEWSEITSTECKKPAIIKNSLSRSEFRRFSQQVSKVISKTGIRILLKKNFFYSKPSCSWGLKRVS